jgi:dolichol-phosphate mannosyltransferase
LSELATVEPAINRPAPAVSVVIPALAEGPNLELMLPQLKLVLDSTGAAYEILLVTSGFDDLTMRAARQSGAQVIQQVERGYGGALLVGFATSRGRYILTMDADLSHPPAVVTGLWERRADADVTVASRYVKGGQAVMPRYRYVLSRILNLIFRRGLGLKIKDLSSGFRIYRAEAIKALSLHSRDFDVLVEILVKAHLNGLTVAEMPFVYQPRQHGTSHARLFKFAFAYIRTFRHLRSEARKRG